MLVVSFHVLSHRCEVFMVSCSSYSEFVYRWRWYSLQPRLFTAYVYVCPTGFTADLYEPFNSVIDPTILT